MKRTKGKISIITICIGIFLLFTMGVISLKGLNKTNALEEIINSSNRTNVIMEDDISNNTKLTYTWMDEDGNLVFETVSDTEITEDELSKYFEEQIELKDYELNGEQVKIEENHIVIPVKLKTVVDIPKPDTIGSGFVKIECLDNSSHTEIYNLCDNIGGWSASEPIKTTSEDEPFTSAGIEYKSIITLNKSYWLEEYDSVNHVLNDESEVIQMTVYWLNNKWYFNNQENTKTIFIKEYYHEKPTSAQIKDIVSNVDVMCVTKENSIGHFDYIGSDRIEIGEVNEIDGKYVCDIIFLSEKFRDAFIELKRGEEHSLCNKDGKNLTFEEANITIRVVWNKTKGEWELEEGTKIPITFYVKCEGQTLWTVNWMKGYKTEGEYPWEEIEDIEPIKSINLTFDKNVIPIVNQSDYPIDDIMQNLRDDSEFIGWGEPVIDELNHIITIKAKWETIQNCNIQFYKEFNINGLRDIISDDFTIKVEIFDLVTGEKLAEGILDKDSNFDIRIYFKYFIEHGYLIKITEKNYEINGYRLLSEAEREEIENPEETPPYSEVMLGGSSRTYGITNIYELFITKEKISWYDEDKTTLLDTNTFKEGETEPVFSKELPTKKADENYIYKFKEWIKQETPLNDDNISYIAEYERIPIKYGSYIVQHEYYTRNKEGNLILDKIVLDDEVIMEVGSIIDVNSIERKTENYIFSEISESITIEKDVQKIITIKYVKDKEEIANNDIDKKIDIVDTSDKNIWIYVVIAIISVVVNATIIILMKSKKQNI